MLFSPEYINIIGHISCIIYSNNHCTCSKLQKRCLTESEPTIDSNQSMKAQRVIILLSIKVTLHFVYYKTAPKELRSYYSRNLILVH